MSTRMTWQIASTESEYTERLGMALGSLLKAPMVLELRSDLGGGKTTFVRGLVRGLGSKDKVSSPTFTLKRQYKADHIEIHHFDFYRLSEPGVLSDQLEESLQNSRVITVVEWSDIVRDVLPDKRLIIEFRPVSNNPDERLIEINYPETMRSLISKLETSVTEIEP
jgi:tRNA threonylcarbamoyladenosine biosynthesis protein TsaE